MVIRSLKMDYITLLWLFSFYNCDVQATTHWMVTENGLIQPREESPFRIDKPYDLLTFLNQDIRWDSIRMMYYTLLGRQKDMSVTWDLLEKDSDINNLMSDVPHCKKSGPLNLVDWYASHMDEGLSKHISQEEYLFRYPMYGQDVDVPDCKKISSLTYSMAAFEHLKSMRQRDNLIIEAEMSLPELISPVMTVEQFGHWVANVLRKNSSSWLHYNLASMYWRVRGNAGKALECSRRAVHYAPRRYKDISLLSMGSTLHRGKKPHDAIIVLGAAVNHDLQCAHGYFILGNVYATLGDYNNSIRHYDKCVKINPGIEQAVKHKHAVLCLKEMIKRKRIVYKTLKKLHTDVRDYASRETTFLKSEAAFLRSMEHREEFDFTNSEKIIAKMTEITGLQIQDLKTVSDRFVVIRHFLDNSKYETWIDQRGIKAIEAAYDLQSLIQEISKHCLTASDFVIQSDMFKVPNERYKKEIKSLPAFNRGPKIGMIQPGIADKFDEEISEYEVRMPLYPPTMKVTRNVFPFDTLPDWPSEQLCAEAAPYTDGIYPVFLPFENKGLRLTGILTDKIGVPLNTEHELPWHPPACPPAKEAVAAAQKKPKPGMPAVVETDTLRQELLFYVGDGDPASAAHMQDAEIGQRIYTAMHKDVAPKWMIYTLASLYWRVRKNNVNALHCLITASKNVKSKFKDVVLTSMASVYLEMGLFDEALQAAEESFRLSLYEPETNFLLALLNMVVLHHHTQLFHMKQAVRVNSGLMGGLASGLLLRWHCRTKTREILEGEICTEVEPGLSMVCEKDGTNCQMSNKQCHSEKESTSTLIRLMDTNEDPTPVPESMDESVFNPFTTNMPVEQTDRAAHEENFSTMVEILENLQGCGPTGCGNIKSEDLALKKENCNHHNLQLNYWLHIVSFQQFITDPELKIPSELLSTPVGAKRIPECKVVDEPSEDIVLSRVTKMTTEGWKQVPSLQHQFNELFHNIDFGVVGAKIAKYLDAHPRSWLAALLAGYWCGAGGHGHCAARCIAAAHSLAPPTRVAMAPRAFTQLLNMQSRHEEAKEWAYLAFYLSPKSKIEAFMIALTYTYQAKYGQAVWMYRYALTFDEMYLPAKACLQATMCVMLFGEGAQQK